MIRTIVFVLCSLLLCCLVLGEENDAPSYKRIIGGTGADWHKYPWLAKNVCMFPGTTEWVVCGCSSTLIHPLYTITAGHCLNGPYTYKVGLQFSDGEVIEVAKETRHPDQSRDSLNYKFVYGVVSESIADIGLQTLARPAGFSKGKQILDILLYQNKDLDANLVGVQGKLLGWGATEQSQVTFPPLPPPEGFSNTLNQIDEIIQPNEQCQYILNGFAEYISGGILKEAPFQFNTSLLCATPVGFTPVYPPEVPPVFKGLCNGDSGGPLFRSAGWLWEKHQVMGFVTDTLSTSLFTPCGNGMDIYTRLTPAYLDWVRSVVFGIPWQPQK